MSLAPGARLGPYEVLAPVGAGGMGEVYKAQDTRLDRPVAIKVLPAHVASDPERKQRFEREAKTLAALSHPHICPVFDVGQQDGIDFLVMEYLEGETLAQRLTRGALPLDQALQYAIQIADALDKAHRKRIVHRDLKPGNIMLTKSGATLLDFGLAKLRDPRSASLSVSQRPTESASLTGEGSILGTLQYMTPEQLEGHEADARTDIFAFGAVLYEMVTGKKAFEGKSQASLIAAILEHDPPAMSALRPMSPPTLDRVVKTCLAKSPDERWQSAADLHRELTWVAESVTQEVSRAAAEPYQGALWRRPISLAAGIAAAVLTALTAGIVVWTLTRSTPAVGPQVARLTIALSPGETLASLGSPAVAISPRGTHVAYVATTGGRQLLHLRAIESTEVQPLAGTELATNPFFSPDGEWIGFFAQGKLKKISLAAGTIQTVCDAPEPRGGSWGSDGSIYLAATGISGISNVSANGGTPTDVTRLDRARGEVSHRWPQVLPDGRAVMFTVWTGPAPDERQVHVQRLDTGERTVVIRGGETGRYVPTGHLIYARGDDLFAVPFDLGRLQGSGQAVRLADVVRGSANTEGAHYAVSDTGTLVYPPGDARRYERRLVSVGRDGRVEPLSAPLRFYNGNAVISPDGRRLAVDIVAGTIGIWIYDFSRGTLTPLATGSGSSQAPQWTPDGQRVVYRGTRSGFRNVWWKAVDDATTEERLTTGEDLQTPGSWSADGQWLVYYEIGPETGPDVWALPAGGDRKPRVIVRTPFAEQAPRLSPDGRWLAYMSNESGRSEVFVQPFPGPGARSQISTDGGTEPVWSRDGRELFYLSGDKMMAVEIRTTPTFAAATPRALFEGRYVRSPQGVSGYDVAADGRFLLIQPMHPDPPTNQIHVVQNWFEELSRLAPPPGR